MLHVVLATDAAPPHAVSAAKSRYAMLPLRLRSSDFRWRDAAFVD